MTKLGVTKKIILFLIAFMLALLASVFVAYSSQVVKAHKIKNSMEATVPTSPDEEIEEEGSAYSLGISTYDDLKDFAISVAEGDNYKDSTVYLKNDIDFNKRTDGEYWYPIGSRMLDSSDMGEDGDWDVAFEGIFDGKGYTIKNLELRNIIATGTDQERLNNWGLFAILGIYSEVKNLKIEDMTCSLPSKMQYNFGFGVKEVDYAEISGLWTNVGAIAGIASPGAKINNCMVDGFKLNSIGDQVAPIASFGGLVGTYTIGVGGHHIKKYADDFEEFKKNYDQVKVHLYIHNNFYCKIENCHIKDVKWTNVGEWKEGASTIGQRAAIIPVADSVNSNKSLYVQNCLVQNCFSTQYVTYNGELFAGGSHDIENKTVYHIQGNSTKAGTQDKLQWDFDNIWKTNGYYYPSLLVFEKFNLTFKTEDENKGKIIYEKSSTIEGDQESGKVSELTIEINGREIQEMELDKYEGDIVVYILSDFSTYEIHPLPIEGSGFCFDHWEKVNASTYVAHFGPEGYYLDLEETITGYLGTETYRYEVAVEDEEKEIKVYKGDKIAAKTTPNADGTYNLKYQIERTETVINEETEETEEVTNVYEIPILYNINPNLEFDTYGKLDGESDEIEENYLTIRDLGDNNETFECIIEFLNEYPIYYNLDGGENHPSNPSTYNKYDTVVLKRPTKLGNKFIGWTEEDVDDDNPVEQVTIPEGSKGAIYYKAWWMPACYYEFIADHGTVESSTGEKVIISELGLEGDYNDPNFYKNYNNPYVFEREGITVTHTADEGYIFEYWELLNMRHSDIYQAMLITWSAEYSCEEYNITYNLGGTEQEDIINNNPIVYDIEDNLHLKEPVRNSYTFLGWTGSNGETPEKDVWISGTGDKEYTAHWEKREIYNITYDLGGGELPSGSSNPTTYTKYDSFTLIKPTMPGHNFIGWTYELVGMNIAGSSTPEENLQIPLDVYDSLYDLKITAHWSGEIIYEYMISINGELTTIGTYTIGDTIHLSAPKLQGYIFYKWIYGARNNSAYNVEINNDSSRNTSAVNCYGNIWFEAYYEKEKVRISFVTYADSVYNNEYGIRVYVNNRYDTNATAYGIDIDINTQFTLGKYEDGLTISFTSNYTNYYIEIGCNHKLAYDEMFYTYGYMDNAHHQFTNGFTVEKASVIYFHCDIKKYNVEYE